MKKYLNLKVVTLFFIFLSIGLMIYSVVVIMKYPLIGMSVHEEDNQWIVEKVYGDGWASAHQIEKGDIIQQIDKEKVGGHATVKLFDRVEMAKSITFLSKSGQAVDYDVSYEDMDKKSILYLFIPLLFSIITMALSIFIYLTVQKDRAGIILIYFLLSIGLCYLGAFVSARGDLAGWLLNRVTLTSSIILLLHFLREYFLRYDTNFIKITLLKALYIVNTLILLMIFVNQIKLGIFDTAKFELIFFTILILILITHLLLLYTHQRNLKNNVVIKILGVTVFFAFGPFIFLYVIPNIFLGKEFIPTEIVAICLIIIPISLVYLLLAEKLFDIAFIMGKLRYYSLLAFPFAVVGVVVLSLFSQIKLTISAIVTLFLIFFVGIIFLLYIKEYIDYKVKHHLFSQKGDFESSLYTFFQKAKHETKVSSLVNYLQAEIEDVLGVKDTFYNEVYTDNGGDSWFIKDRGSYPPAHTKKVEAVNWNYCSIGTLLEVSDGFGIVIGGGDNHKKVILFGMKNSQTNLNIQEKIWLETLAYFSSILLENFELIEGLVDEIENYKETSDRPLWLSRLLFSLAEKERTNLSIDLHDSVLQDQLQLLREIEQMATRVTDLELKNDLANLQEKMLDNIHMVRETCNELQPPFLSEIGVIQSIQNLVDQTKLRCSFILTSELDSSIQWLNKEVELALYRVVQELLNNAMEHSQASQVKLTLHKNNQDLSLFYQDDGIGFDVEELNDSFKTMGLFGVRERVRSLGGIIEIDSAKGKGMSVQIAFEEGDHKYD